MSDRKLRIVNKRNQDGSYTLTYGRGKAKLTAVMMKCDDGTWTIDSGLGAGLVRPQPTMKECKAAWGPLAVEAYGSPAEPAPASKPKRTPKAEPDPEPEKRIGPPPRLKRLPPKLPPPKIDWSKVTWADERLTHPERGYTPLGFVLRFISVYGGIQPASTDEMENLLVAGYRLIAREANDLIRSGPPKMGTTRGIRKEDIPF